MIGSDLTTAGATSMSGPAADSTLQSVRPPTLDLGWPNALRRMARRVPYYVAYVRNDPRWLLMFLGGRFVAIRRLVMDSSHKADADLPRDGTIFPDIDVGTAVQTLQQEGLFRGLDLPAPIVAGIRRFADTTTCYGNLDRALPFMPAQHEAAEAEYGQPILVGHFLDKVAQCPEISTIRNDPTLRSIVHRYLGTGSLLRNTRLWWSFPTKGYDEVSLSRASQGSFHFDLIDWGALKFFFYLTEVNNEAGPHVYVRESHRRRPLRHQFTLLVVKSAEEIVSTYGPERVTVIHGPAGHGFAEEPFGYHMGSVPRRRRLMLELEYGISEPSAIDSGAIGRRERTASFRRLV